MSKYRVIWLIGLSKYSDEIAAEQGEHTFFHPLDHGNFEQSYKEIDQSSDFYMKAGKHIIAINNEDMPLSSCDELIRRLGPENCNIAKYPGSCTEFDDLCDDIGVREAIIQIIKFSKPVPIDGIIEPIELREKVFKLRDKGIESGLTTGWSELDRFYTVKEGYYTVVTGIPSMGKSEFIDALAVNMATLHKWKIAVFSPENFPLELYTSKLIRKVTGKAFGKGFSGISTPEEDSAALEFIQNSFTYFTPKQNDDMSIDDILQLSKLCVSRKGVNGIIIDPWTEVDHSRPANLSETEYISKSLTKIRRFSRNYNVHIWIIAHPTKMSKNKDGSYGVPTPYDISGSAHWRNKPDFCLSVHRDLLEEGAPVEIHIQKGRFRHLAKPGLVSLNYDITSGRYS